MDNNYYNNMNQNQNQSTQNNQNGYNPYNSNSQILSQRVIPTIPMILRTHRIPVTPAIPETRKIPIIPATPVSSMDLVDQIINDKLHKMRYNRLSEHNSGNLFCILKQHCLWQQDNAMG